MSCRPLFTIELGVHLKSVGLLWWTFDDVSYWLGNWYFGKSWKWACSNYTFVSRDWVEWMLIHALWFTRCLSFPYRLQVGASCFLLHLSAFCTVFMDRSIWFNLCVFFSFWPLRLFDLCDFLTFATFWLPFVFGRRENRLNLKQGGVIRYNFLWTR